MENVNMDDVITVILAIPFFLAFLGIIDDLVLKPLMKPPRPAGKNTPDYRKG